MFTTKAQQETFRIRWHRLYRQVSLWSASPEGLPEEEGRMVHRLLYLADRANRFEIVLKPVQVQEGMHLKRREVFKKTRTGLEKRNILASDFDSVTATWRFTLHDPQTGQPFDDDDVTDESTAFHPNSSWEDVDF